MRTILPLAILSALTATAAAEGVGCDFRFGLGYGPGPNDARNQGTDFKLRDGGAIMGDFGIFLTVPAHSPVAWLIGFSFETRDSSSDFEDPFAAQVNSLDYSSFGFRLDTGITIRLGRHWSLEPVVFASFGGATGDFHDGPGAGTNSGSYGELGAQVNGFFHFNRHWKLGVYGGYQSFSANLEQDVKVKGESAIAGVTGGYSF